MSEPKRLITTWAHQLSARIPQYGEVLLKSLREQDHTKQSLRDESVADLFAMLLSGPLHQLQTPPTQPVCVLLDALDECEHQGRNELLRLILTKWDELPAWMRLLVTTRPSGGTAKPNDIVTKLRKFNPRGLPKISSSHKRVFVLVAVFL